MEATFDSNGQRGRPGLGSEEGAKLSGDAGAVTVALPWLLRFRWAVLAGQLLFVSAGRKIGRAHV